MSDKPKPKSTSPPASSSKPPWQLTTPPSAEKLMRALSIDPFTTDNPTSSHGNPFECTYFSHLEQISSPSYKDPPVPSIPLPKEEPLFIDEDEDDDIQVGTDNRMELFKSPVSPTQNTALVKRPLDEDDDSDIEFTGAHLPPDGKVDLGPPVKRRRRVKVEKQVEEDNEEEEEEASQLAEVDETLQEVEPLQRGCMACGCFCNDVGRAPRNSGSGSTTLSPRVLGDILRMLMGDGHSLLSVASRMYPGINTWADIAERVGARREDFDRVRHAASDMQQKLPVKKARGDF